MLWLDSDHKINIKFTGTYFEGAPGNIATRTQWTALDGASIGGVLGFDTTADLDFVSGTKGTANHTADYQHAYGWYAGSDGQLADESLEDIDVPLVSQSTVPTSGHTKTAYSGSSYVNQFLLQFLTKEETWSDESDYTDAQVYPYERNKGLECWWREARQGVPFRFYKDSIVDISKASEGGVATGSAPTTLTASGKAWTVNQWAGRLLYVTPFDYTTGELVRYHIASNTATVLTMTQASEPLLGTYTTYHVFDQPYETYWLDLSKTKRFDPQEMGHGVAIWQFPISLLRYES